jgi:F0F1-type ATP synthase membrane subunit c/vacuolar-type H+-ATPase subunit K
LEAATPGRSLPSKQELLAFQGRWLRRAGLAGLVGAFIVAASVVLQQVGLNVPSGKSDAEQLVFEHAHSSRLIYSSILQALGLMAFVVPLLFLFRSASGRAARMRGAFAGLIVLGPLAFGLGLALSSVGSTKAADKFHTQEPAVVQHARQQAEQAQGAPAKNKVQGAGTTAGPKTQATTTATTTTASTGSTTINLNGTTTIVATPVTPGQAGSNARENLADHINKHTTLLIVGGLISTIGLLSLVFGMIYTNLWAMRTGLLSRFWGALGMAFGLFLVIPLFPPIPGLVLWFAAIGLMFLGLWPRPLPPAWEAGEAVPWQRRGDDLGPPPSERGPAGTVEGSGREVSETPLPENGDGGGDQDQAMDQSGETQGQRRKKRKRRG